MVLVPAAGCCTVKNTVSDGQDSNLILRDNDPVACFTDKAAIQCNPAIRTDYNGATRRFINAANRAGFLKPPARDEHACTGSCASGAPYALKANIHAQVFTIYRDRLYLLGGKRGWLPEAANKVAFGERYREEETKNVPHRMRNRKRHLFKLPHTKTDDELDAEKEKHKFAAIAARAAPNRGAAAR